MKSSIDGLTAWANVRLASKNCQAENILKDIMEGQRMKALLECITGSTSKRLDTLDGLTFNQKVIRVDWFVDALRASNKLPSKLKVDSKYFAMHSSDHVFPVLWTLVEHDVSLLRDLSSIYIKQPNPQVTIAEPFRLGPACHVKTDQPKLFYLTVGGESLINPLRKRLPPAQRPTAQDSLIELTHLILKSTPEGKRLQFNDISDLTDTRILCALVNTIIPGTFTSEVLLNDRWTINLALNCLSKIFRVLSPVDSETLTEEEELGSFPFIAYFLLCSYQFVQTRAVIRRLEQIEREEKDIQKMTTTGSREEKLAKLKDEREWILSVYDMELCSDWLKHAAQVQSEMRMKMTIMMKQRFDVVVVPRPMTINELVDSLFINLALTSQNGFYQSANKEKLWPKRRMVVRDKDTGEFYDDFSGSPSCQGSIRHMLGLSPSGVEDVKASDYAQFELYFESTSRNKILKAGSCFLYQVFPGSTLQCQRLTLQAAKKGDLTTIQKLVVFFRRNKDFVNSKDPHTGNTALHLASRYGHFDLAQYLLENGASVNCLNSSGCTPLFCAVDGLHKSLCHLLLEWGADLRVRNNANMAAPDLVRNDDLRSFLEEKFSEYRELTTKALAGNVAFFEQYLRTHCREGGGTASLRSRSIKGNTLLHQAVIVGSIEGVKLLLSEHVPVNITNHLGATPLHLARRIDIVQHLVECGGDVNGEDDDGNTPLHCICSDQESADDALKCIPFMVEKGCFLDTPNSQKQLPIHYAASCGLMAVIQSLMACDEGKGMMETLKHWQSEVEPPPSLPYLALVNDHQECAEWLVESGFVMSGGEADDLLLMILKGPPEKCQDPIHAFQFLLKQGADPNAEYADGNRPLHLSSSLLMLPEITGLLLEAGADLNARNKQGFTPLFVACQVNNPYVANQLIVRGADYKCKDSSGMCALDYILDYEEWMDCSHFNDDMRARLKAYSLKQAKELVHSITVSLQRSEFRT